MGEDRRGQPAPQRSDQDCYYYWLDRRKWTRIINFLLLVFIVFASLANQFDPADLGLGSVAVVALTLALLADRAKRRMVEPVGYDEWWTEAARQDDDYRQGIARGVTSQNIWRK